MLSETRYNPFDDLTHVYNLWNVGVCVRNADILKSMASQRGLSPWLKLLPDTAMH